MANAAQQANVGAWTALLNRMKQQQQAATMLNLANNASPSTMLGYGLGKLLGDGFRSWKSNYNDRAAQKDVHYNSDLGKYVNQFADKDTNAYVDALINSDGGYGTYQDMVKNGATVSDFNRWGANYQNEKDNPTVIKGWNEYVAMAGNNEDNAGSRLNADDWKKYYPGDSSTKDNAKYDFNLRR